MFVLDCAEVDLDLGHFARVQVENVTNVRVNSLRVGMDTELIVKKAGSLVLGGRVEPVCLEREDCSGNNKSSTAEYQVQSIPSDSNAF